MKGLLDASLAAVWFGSHDEPSVLRPQRGAKGQECLVKFHNLLQIGGMTHKPWPRSLTRHGTGGKKNLARAPMALDETGKSTLGTCANLP